MTLSLHNKRFGRYTTAIAPTAERSGGSIVWLCRCDCGDTFRVPARDLTAAKFVGKHLMCKLQKSRIIDHDLYNIWRGMKVRCDEKNKNKKIGKYYASKGITVCDRWKNSFEAFAEDMGPRPSNKHSIDRIDGSLGYFKENCRWATSYEQSTNMNKFTRQLSAENYLEIYTARYTTPPEYFADKFQVSRKTVLNIWSLNYSPSVTRLCTKGHW